MSELSYLRSNRSVYFTLQHLLKNKKDMSAWMYECLGDLKIYLLEKERDFFEGATFLHCKVDIIDEDILRWDISYSIEEDGKKKDCPGFSIEEESLSIPYILAVYSALDGYVQLRNKLNEKIIITLADIEVVNFLNGEINNLYFKTSDYHQRTIDKRDALWELTKNLPAEIHLIYVPECLND